MTIEQLEKSWAPYKVEDAERVLYVLPMAPTEDERNCFFARSRIVNRDEAPYVVRDPLSNEVLAERKLYLLWYDKA